MIDETYKQVYNHLQKEFKENDQFRKELESIMIFYGRKLIAFAKNEKEQLYIENGLEDVIRSLYFQGYYTMKVILSDEDTEILEDVWKMPIGVCRNEIPKMLENIFAEVKTDWKRTDVSHEFSMEILTNLEPAYEVTKAMIKEMAIYGAFKAFVEDERYQGMEEVDSASILLGNPFDIEFLSPQVFHQVSFLTNQHEIWDLFFWSAIRENAWVGTIHYSILPIEDNTFYVMECNLSDLISKDEKLEIIDLLAKRLPPEQKSKLQIRLYNVGELEVLESQQG